MKCDVIAQVRVAHLFPTPPPVRAGHLDSGWAMARPSACLSPPPRRGVGVRERRRERMQRGDEARSTPALVLPLSP